MNHRRDAAAVPSDAIEYIISPLDIYNAVSRYNRLLARVGSAISIHPELVKLVSYIILFSGDFTGVK